jgi:hypothetical protein
VNVPRDKILDAASNTYAAFQKERHSAAAARACLCDVERLELNDQRKTAYLEIVLKQGLIDSPRSCQCWHWTFSVFRQFIEAIAAIGTMNWRSLSLSGKINVQEDAMIPGAKQLATLLI